MDFLRGQGVIPPEKIASRRLTPAEQEALAFERYLRDERVLARATVVNYVPFIRSFLTHRFGHGPVRLSRLCAGDVVRFVQRQAPRLHLKRAKLLTTALRSFLHYVRYRGDIVRDLAAAVPSVASARSETPIRGDDAVAVVPLRRRRRTPLANLVRLPWPCACR